MSPFGYGRFKGKVRDCKEMGYGSIREKLVVAAFGSAIRDPERDEEV